MRIYKKEKISQRKKLLYAIAENLRDTTVDFVDLMTALTDRHSYRQLAGGSSLDGVREKWHRRKEYEQRQLLAKLEYQKWVTLRHTAGRISIVLTPKGTAILRKERIRCARKCRMNEGVLVTFDIPERARDVRDQFRSFLKECNFQIVERSVWFTNRDVFDEIRAFIHETKSEKWIHVFRVANTFVK